jgi:hypothetical protein
MDMAKIRLSSAELELVSDPSLILTKNGIVKKAWGLLAELQLKQNEVLDSNTSLPSEVLTNPGKISKGENYMGLPYLILDHPRAFFREGVLAIRTMFWWGNYFSTTLHLSGKYKEEFQEKIIGNFDAFGIDYSICINENQWEHHFGEKNYLPVKRFDKSNFTREIKERDFIKIGKTVPFQQWETAVELLFNDFVFLLKKMED